ncbi:serine hydrolase [Winogradskyella sp. PG-2]|uniref:serine hydrolase n=1 Tax=Winogradskyella sp. PG-2 TaxID=754409 RepID=UPI000458951B|nr:serine hydrolase [Winogradskyella sp. PG-2]BAO77189.1 D-alanyl-D-alanine carboxypeptidase [Winogradskyella sp. PG-2]
MKFKFYLLVFFLLCQFSFAQNLEIPEAVKTHIKARVDNGFNPSVSLAYIDGGDVSYFNYGKTEVNNGKHVNENSVYEIGSISKVFTTILLADEVLRGNMKLSDPVSKYLPNTFTIPQRNEKVITLKDLATHTSGLPRMPDNFSPADINNPFADYKVSQLYEFLISYKLPRDIALAWHFANNNLITWHNGGTGGYRAFAGFLNNTKRGVVVLTNSTFSVDQIGLKLLDATINLELPKKSEFPDVVSVSNEILDTYIGVYQLAPEFTITISRIDNELYAQATGQSKFQVFPSAENEFFLRVVEASVTFNKDADGKVDSLILHQGGQDMPAPKIE